MSRSVKTFFQSPATPFLKNEVASSSPLLLPLESLSKLAAATHRPTTSGPAAGRGAARRARAARRGRPPSGDRGAGLGPEKGEQAGQLPFGPLQEVLVPDLGVVVAEKGGAVLDRAADPGRPLGCHPPERVTGEHALVRSA